MRTITGGTYITEVVDPTYVQSAACWLGNWRVNSGGSEFRLHLRRSEDFANPGQATRLGAAYLGDGPHDVNGSFSNNGAHLTFHIAPSTAPTDPGTLSGWQFNVDLNLSVIYNADGWSNSPSTMTRFNTRFPAFFELTNGHPFAARHAIGGATYPAQINVLGKVGYRPVWVNGYSEGIGTRFNAVWEQSDGPPWVARQDLTDQGYQTTSGALLAQGYRLRFISGYAENGRVRYAAIRDRSAGPDWQARHGLSRSQYQQTFDQMAADGYAPVQISGYRIGVDVRYAALWERRPGLGWVDRHASNSSEYRRLSTKTCGPDTGWYRSAGIPTLASPAMPRSGMATLPAIGRPDTA